MGRAFAYLLRQMHDLVDGRRPNMRAQHLKILDELDVKEPVSLARYISHLDAAAAQLRPKERMAVAAGES